MNGESISSDDLYALLCHEDAPVLVDVRKQDAFAADDRLIVGAIHRPLEGVDTRLRAPVDNWARSLPTARWFVAYCVNGHEVSQEAATFLRSAGKKARYLEGGIAAWKENHLPTRRKRDVSENKWVTCGHPKIDRIACPWLVRRFINPQAEFIYVHKPNNVTEVAKNVNGTPYDITGAQFGDVGDRCSFDAIVSIYDIKDTALDHLATIVRGADTSRPELTPQCEGLLAICYGLSANSLADRPILEQGLVVYDALYAWCRSEARDVRA